MATKAKCEITAVVAHSCIGRSGAIQRQRPITQRVRNDDEDHRHEAMLLLCLSLRSTFASPVAAFGVHNGCGLGGSRQRMKRAAASDAIG
jgi:hypothetical protein